MIHNVDAWEYIKTVPDNHFDAIITDPMYYEILMLDEFFRICKGNIILFGDPAYRSNYRVWEKTTDGKDVAVPAHFDAIHHWVKPPSTKNTIKKMSNFVEEILVIRRGETYNRDLPWANYQGVWFDVIETVQEHPYQKPLSLMSRLINVYTNPGDLIFDPFAGSGTTLKAAEVCGRDAVGCENNSFQWKKS